MGRLWAAGPSRRRWTELTPHVGDAAADVELLDLEGTTRSPSEFWSERPTIVEVWRHFGCNCGIGRAERLQDEYEGCRDAGPEVVVVTEGELERAANYAERYGIEGLVLCSRPWSGRGVRPARFRPRAGPPGRFNGYLELNPDAGTEFAAERRDLDQYLVDNPRQQPGEFLVDTDGRIRLAHRYQYCEDYPDPEVFLTALGLLE